ncbi:Putative AC9 transposase, partial [Linum grandiflorum]
MKAQCNHSKKYLAGHSSHGTLHLRNHLTTCLLKKIKDGTQKVLEANYLVKGKKEVSSMSYSSEVSRQQLGIAMVMHGYPLSIVDHLYFKRFVCSLQPLFHMPYRNTMKKEILKLYDHERKKLQKRINLNFGKVIVTTDLWTATNQKNGYMAITGHYMENAWTLHSHLLSFAYLPAPHTAERMASVLLKCLMDWNTDSKISTITLDNCSMNNSMIDKVKPKLLSAFLIRDGAMLHMRCAAHILNL